MKKVLFTATVDSHILAFHLPFLKYFKEQGYEVHVATNGTEEIPYCDKKIVIPFERSPFKLNNLKAIKLLRNVIEEEKYDIIHTHTPMGSVVTRLAAKKARKNGTRVIYTAHGFHFFKGAPLLNWLVFYPVEKYLSKYTDTLITINMEDYELAKNKFKKCKDVEYVPGVGIDEEKFNFKLSKKEQKEIRESLDLEEDDFVMIFPAELNKNKNQIMLINAMEELTKKYKNIKLLLPGKDSYNGFYQNTVKEKKLDKYIKFLGFRKDIPKLLKISDLAVATSKREGLPVNIMEAMYVGLPIVASNCRGNRDLVTDNKNGFLINLDSEVDFVESIKKIYSSNELKKEFSKESQEEIKKYMLDKIMTDMKKIYNAENSSKIAFLRSTAIYNDSRATKEINSYNDLNNEVIVLGWNRQNDIENISWDKKNEYNFYNKKSEYGSGFKNIFKIISFNFWIYKNLKKNIGKFDIIHACDFDTAIPAYLIAKKYNKKLIYDIYDYYSDCHNLGILKNIVEHIDIKIINNSDTVYICTEQREEQISKARPKRLEVIHNSPNISSFGDYKNKENSRKINIGYFGILQDDRLLIEIIEKIKGNKDVIFHIGGFGKHEKYIKEVSEKYDNIIFYGKLKYSEVIEHEKKCNILFATYNPEIKNHKYSAPNKVYEAMALNLPIIVCKDTGVDTLVEKEKIGLAIKYDADEFLEAVLDIGRKKMCDYKKTFKEKYSWEVMQQRIKKTIEFLRNK